MSWCSVRTPDIDISGNTVINSHSPSNVTPCDSILAYAQVYVRKNRKRADVCGAWDKSMGEGFCN